jgi:hypothetical protein
MAQINQIAEGISRISSFSPTVGISFNQFLLDDEHPTLLHTGTYPLYEGCVRPCPISSTPNSSNDRKVKGYARS